MTTLWHPIDNKYVTECEVKIKACEARLLRLEEDVFKWAAEIVKIKLKVYALSKTITYLQEKALVVSFEEFAEIRSELARFVDKIEMGELRVTYMESAIEGIRKEIEGLEKLKEKVKFKLIKFRGKNEKS